MAVAGVLRGVREIVAEGAAAFKVAELTREVPSLHAVAAGSEMGPTGLQLD